jgi:hypothetical protein
MRLSSFPVTAQNRPVERNRLVPFVSGLRKMRMQAPAWVPPQKIAEHGNEEIDSRA